MIPSAKSSRCLNVTETTDNKVIMITNETELERRVLNLEKVQGELEQRLSEVENRIGALETEMVEVKKELNKVKKELNKVKRKLEKVNIELREMKKNQEKMQRQINLIFEVIIIIGKNLGVEKEVQAKIDFLEEEQRAEILRTKTTFANVVRARDGTQNPKPSIRMKVQKILEAQKEAPRPMFMVQRHKKAFVEGFNITSLFYNTDWSDAGNKLLSMKIEDLGTSNMEVSVKLIKSLFN